MAKLEVWKAAAAGTHVDTQMPKGVMVAFCALALVVVLVPFVGMVWARTDTTTENRELVAFPALFASDGSFNVNILSDLGAYFSDHFAYRNEAVTANARLEAALGVSATDQVVVGTEGWLYYAGTLPDYLGQNRLSNRALVNIAHNLKLAQDYSQAHGATFAFALAPNKNSLNASHMPYYYKQCPDESNVERLRPLLEQAGVNYVDLFKLLLAEQAETGDFGYLKTDSHWTNRWALLAANEILHACNRASLPVDPASAEQRNDFEGDLQSMLYPAAHSTELNDYYARYNDNSSDLLWRYEEGSAVTDGTVRTSSTVDVGEGAVVVAEDAADTSSTDNRAAEGSLLMFRDSFGNALLPFFASAFERATFSKLVPYNLAQISQDKPSVVVVERAERHLDYLSQNPPIMSNPQCTLPEEAQCMDSDVSIKQDGSYWIVTATLKEAPVDDSAALYLVIDVPGATQVVLDPFWTSDSARSSSVQDEVVADANINDNTTNANAGDRANADDNTGVSSSRNAESVAVDGLLADWNVRAYIPATALDLSNATVELWCV